MEMLSWKIVKDIRTRVNGHSRVDLFLPEFSD